MSAAHAMAAPAEEEAVWRFARAGRCFVVRARPNRRFWRKAIAGDWEPRSFDALAALTGPGTHFLDCGAWIGPLTLFAAAGGARVTAVEPDPSALERLAANLSLNPDLAARVSVVAAALTADGAPIRLGVAEKTGGGDSLSSQLRFPEGPGVTVAGVTPEALLARVEAGERLVVKIDVEGAEYLLADALAPLLRRADAVMLSFHPGFAASAHHGRMWTAARTTRLLAAAGPRRLRRVDPATARPSDRLIRGLLRLGLPVWPLSGEWLLLAPGGPSDRALAAETRR